MKIEVIDDKYSLLLQTLVRAETSSKEEIQKSLIELGEVLGKNIVGNYLIESNEILTPMQKTFNGYTFKLRAKNIVYSTKDDFNFFAKGIANMLPNVEIGYMDFNGVRGEDALTQPIRGIKHPNIQKNANIDTVVIAKAVLATGCTAISLTRNILAKYQPNHLIIASAFYSERGIEELLNEFPKLAGVYLIGEKDNLDHNGMLIPGVGNLDERIQESIGK